MNNLKTTLLLTLLFVICNTNICFADVYIGPTEKFLTTLPTIFVFALIILTVLLIITLMCILVGKINKSEELINKSRNIAEILFYYILIISGLAIATFILSNSIVISIFPFIATFLSLFFRFKVKNIKISYLIISTYLIIILIVYIYVTTRINIYI